MDIELQLSRFIADELLDSGGAVAADDALLADGLVDSLGMMRIVGFIGEALGVDVPAEDVVIENFSTVSRIAEYLRRKGA